MSNEPKCRWCGCKGEVGEHTARKWTAFACGTTSSYLFAGSVYRRRWSRTGTCRRIEIWRLRRRVRSENARLQAIAARLPKTHDGVPITPDMEVWTCQEWCQEPVSGFRVLTIELDLDGNWWIHLRDENGAQGGIDPDQLYSTHEAAEAASSGRGGDTNG